MGIFLGSLSIGSVILLGLLRIAEENYYRR